MIKRACGLVLVVLIARPFTAPFEAFDLHGLTASAHDTEIAGALSAPTTLNAQDDTPALFERSDLRHSMELSGLNGSGRPPARVPRTPPLVPPAAMSPSPTANAVVTVQRV